MHKNQPPCTRGRTFPIELLTSTEVSSLLGQFSRRAPSGIRNQALIVVLWRAGLRLQEALDLHPRDIDVDAATINVRSGKTGQRIVGIDHAALTVVSNWIDRRAALGARPNMPLFCQITTGRVGQPMSQQYVRAAMKRAAARAGIDKRVHPHQLRHVMASSLARERFPINLIQQQLGHRSLSSTQVYLSKIAPEELATAMSARAW